MNFLTNLDLNKNQLLNGTIHNVASDPAGTAHQLGQIIYNTTDLKIKTWNGSSWEGAADGTMSSFTLAADTGTSASIADGGTVTIAGSGSVSTVVSVGTVTISIDDVTNAELENDSITLTNTDGHLTFANSGVVALGDSLAIETSGLVDTTTDQTIAGVKTFSDNAIFNGDLTVNGTTTTLDTDNLLVQDALIVVAKDQVTGILDAGLVIERGSDTSQAMLWDESDNTFVFADVAAEDGSTNGAVTISSYAKLKTGDLTVDGNATINTIAANTTPTVVLTETSGTIEKSTIAELFDGNAVESISASGTAPLNLSVDASTGAVALTGTVDIATDAQAVSGTDTDVLLTPASLRATEDVSTITGNSVLTSFDIDHNMNTRNVIVQLFDDSTFETVIAEVTRTTADQVTVDFGFAVPTGTTYTVLIKAIA
tara:strand:+ start:5427 stop:6707 length:1281 start_codon:yes stop_codon:yes gene_type:complete